MSAKYQVYSEYKSSEIEWADVLPVHWGRVSLRWISEMYAGGTPSKNVEEYWEDGTVPWLNSGAVNQGLVTEASTYITVDAFKNSSAKWIPKDALVMALAGQGKTKGMVAQLGIETTCNQSMAAIVPNALTNSRFLFWWLMSNYQNIRNMSGGDNRDGLNLELLGNIECPIPTDNEKEKIANFLDHETAKIDTLIEKQQQLIKLLKEKRQAVISHAVTKGLNPNAPMRDSGIEWLGEVPEGWEVISINNLVRQNILSIQDGNHGESHPKASEFKTYGVPFLMAANMDDGKVDLESCHFITSERASGLRISPALPGDVLLSHKGNQLGEVAVLPKDIDYSALVLTPQITYYRIEKPLIDQYFLRSILESKQLQDQLWFFASVQATRPYVGITTQLELKVVMPPLIEQQKVTNYLKAKVERFDFLLDKSELQISLLKERRTALISAAVTGKIDVRNWVEPEPSDNQNKEVAA